jgi:hypothetical protein
MLLAISYSQWNPYSRETYYYTKMPPFSTIRVATSRCLITYDFPDGLLPLFSTAFIDASSSSPPSFDR